ncbi:MAG: hypothetical protein WA919_21730 [Coleofasciculaceae cyanobacterium]
MPVEVVVIIAAVILSFLLFRWLIKVVKATVPKAIAIAVIFLVLQLMFGIGPSELWQQLNQIVQNVFQTNNGR